jgi:hypothetical protein
MIWVLLYMYYLPLAEVVAAVDGTEAAHELLRHSVSESGKTAR